VLSAAEQDGQGPGENHGAVGGRDEETQCRHSACVQVELVLPGVFAAFPTLHDLAGVTSGGGGAAGGASHDDGPSRVAALEGMLRPLGLFRTRARRLVAFARAVLGLPQLAAGASHAAATSSDESGTSTGEGDDSDVTGSEDGSDGSSHASDGSDDGEPSAASTGSGVSRRSGRERAPKRQRARKRARPDAGAPVEWWCPCQLPGMGQYAVEAFWLLLTDRWREITPTDHALQWYRQWRGDHEGDGAGGETG
jgi:hypothetical protein